MDINQPQEWAPWMNHSNPPDSIDYKRPREGFYMSTIPTEIPEDAAAVVDSNDGWLGDAWEAVKSFVGVGPDKKEEKKEEKPDEELEELSESLKEDVKSTVKAKGKAKDSSLNLAFQSFFGKSHPIIGQLYTGPKDGKMNSALKAAARSAESKIGSEIGGSVGGMILAGKGFATSPADVQGALAVIAKHKKGKPTVASLYLDAIK